MISEYTLKMLCDKYNLSVSKIVNKNNNILEYGKFLDIDRTLDYLINVLRISTKNIEKCPSILYRNVDVIKQNVEFLKKQDIHFSNVESCLHVLSSDPNELKETYNYVVENYGINAINKNTSILSCGIEIIKEVENLNLNIGRNSNLSIAIGINFEYTSLEEIQKIIQSKEFKEYQELFTSTTLAHARLEEIQEIIQSKEFKEHPKLFTSQTLAYAKLEDIQKIIQSKEFKEHPELFTSQTLAHAKLEDIQKIIQSKEFKEHPELLTSQTLAHAKLEEIQKIIQSPEFKAHPEMFTSTTLAHAKLEEIQKIIQSPEFKEHPELFTSETLAHAKLEEIQKIIQSPEFKSHPELFTSTILAKSKSMIIKLPILFELAQQYEIENYINTSFLLFSPSQNYALIKYLNENNIQLVIDGKLNSIFGKPTGVLKKKYGIDIKELMTKYSYKEDNKKKVKIMK